MDVTFLKEIAIASENRQLKELVKNYEDVISSKTLQEVVDYIPHYEIRNRLYSRLKVVFNDENLNTITVKKLKQQCQIRLATDIALYVEGIKKKCVAISYLISTNEVYQTFLSALTVPQESRLNDSLQIGAWMVYPPQFVLQELRKNHDFGWLPCLYFINLMFFSLFRMHRYVASCNVVHMQILIYIF